MGQLALCKKNIAQAREQRDKGREAQALIALGKMYQEQGQRKLALDAWRDASSLLHAMRRDRELAELYQVMAGVCLDMGWTQKGCRCYEWARDLYLKLGDMPEVGRLFVQVGALENWNIDNNKWSFQQARIIFRMRGDTLWEARSYLVQARTYWRRRYDEEALGYLRYAQDLLAQLPLDAGSEQPPDIETARQLEEYFRQAYRSEDAYAQARTASVQTYEEARGEEEAVRKQMEEYYRDLLPDIEQLGLLRHDVARTEADAAPALKLIKRLGYSRAAIPSYKASLPRLRSRHNRLAEAIIEGTITLLCILLRERYTSSETTLELYQEAHCDPLGLGRAHFNAAIHVLLSGESHADAALAHLWRAEDLLGEARAPRGEIGRGRAQRIKLKRQLGPAAYTRARKSALEEYARRQEEASGRVSLYTFASSGAYNDLTEVGREETDNFLSALHQILAALLEEGVKPYPRRLTLAATRGDSILIEGTTTGRSLASSTSPISQTEGETLLRVRFLHTIYQDEGEIDVRQLFPLGSKQEPPRGRSRRLSRTQLEELAIDHLDRRYVYHDDDRAIEVLNEQNQQVCLLRCGPLRRQIHSLLQPEPRRR